MSERESRLEARLRGLFAGVDTRPDFEARLVARIATQVPAQATGLRAQYERRRELGQRRLRREYWSNVATIGAIGAAASAVLWRHSGSIVQFFVAGGMSQVDPWLIAGLTAAALAAGLWPQFRRLLAA